LINTAGIFIFYTIFIGFNFFKSKLALDCIPEFMKLNAISFTMFGRDM